METKKKLGQNPAYPFVYKNISSGEDDVCPGMTERRKIAADVLCALLSNSKSTEMIAAEYGKIEPEKVHEIVVKTALSITDTFLKLESE